MQNREGRLFRSLQTEIVKPKNELRSFKSQQNQQEQKQELTHHVDINFDEMECQLKIEMKICKLPQSPIWIDDDGKYWSLIRDQKLNQQVDDKHMPQYINDQGVISNIDIQIIEQKAIQITANQEDHNYIGILTEQEINQNQNYLSIEKVFSQLIIELNNDQQNTQEDSIKMNQNGQNIELELKFSNKIEIFYIKDFTLKWNLLRQKDDQIVDKRMKSIQKTLKKLSEEQIFQQQQLYQFKEQQQDEFQHMKAELIKLSQLINNNQNLKQNEDNNQKQVKPIPIQQFNQTKQIITNESDSVNQFLIPTSEIHSIQFNQLNKSIDKSFPFCLYQQNEMSQNQDIDSQVKNLEKISEIFWIWPQTVKGTFIFKFTIKVINTDGLVIGLDSNNNPGNSLAYGIQLHQKYLIIGQNKIALQSVLGINDKVIFTVDTDERIAVLMFNWKEVIQSRFENQGQKELYFYVGSLNQVEDINTIID